FFSSRRRHTRFSRDWSSDVCSSDLQQKPAGVLSGGECNRLNLALTLKQGGILILLDEPTNDLDVETLGSLENALENFPGCAVVRSEERRVGKEGRSGGWWGHEEQES